jgi:hypothetical protein
VVTLDEFVPDPLPVKRPDVLNVKCTIRGLQPGRYIVDLSWRRDPKRLAAEPRKLYVYRGDETPSVKTAYCRKLASQAYDGTREGYERARSFLERAMADTTQPIVFEELGDLSAPWASPQETADYYERASRLSRRNIEARFGANRSLWSPRAISLQNAQDQKTNTFRSLVHYYTENFNTVRIVAIRRPTGQEFEIQRRTDGKLIRKVEIPSEAASH